VSINVASVRRQITPTTAYVLRKEIHPGERLTAEHLSEIQVAGGVNTEILLTPAEVFQAGRADGSSSLEEQLEQTPRFASRISLPGELVVEHAFGGRETLQPGANEELLQVPRTAFRGGTEKLQPGQVIYLLSTDRSTSALPSSATPQELGPFRVALLETSEDDRGRVNGRQGTLPLIYRLNADGSPPEYAKALRRATVQSNQSALAVIEKGRRLATSKRTLASR
jgi:hypothetical protein